MSVCSGQPSQRMPVVQVMYCCFLEMMADTYQSDVAGASVGKQIPCSCSLENWWRLIAWLWLGLWSVLEARA